MSNQSGKPRSFGHVKRRRRKSPPRATHDEPIFGVKTFIDGKGRFIEQLEPMYGAKIPDGFSEFRGRLVFQETTVATWPIKAESVAEAFSRYEEDGGEALRRGLGIVEQLMQHEQAMEQKMKEVTGGLVMPAGLHVPKGVRG